MNFLDTIFQPILTAVEHFAEGVVSLVGGAVGYYAGGVPGAVIGAGGSQVVIEQLPPFKDTVEGLGHTLTECTTQACTDAVMNQLWWEQTYSLMAQFGWIAAFIFLGIVLITYLIGVITPNLKQMRYKKERNKAMKMLFDDPNVKMEDMK